jgi:hypothetical protein
MTKFNIQRQQEDELPLKLNIQFINKNTDYQQGSQQARRRAPKSQQKVSVNSPIVFTDEEAIVIAEKLLYNVWVERDRFFFTLPRPYAYLTPTDVVALIDEDSGLEFIVRIVNITSNRTGTSQIEAVADTSTVYLQNPVASPSTVTPQTFPVSSATKAYLFEVPPLRASDVSSGFYLAMSGETEVWAGGLLYQSLDGGANYSPYSGGAPAATMGVTETALGTATNFNALGDTTNTLRVQVYGGKTLSSTTNTGISAGVNLAAVEGTDGWEIIQFRDANLVSAGVYDISTFSRGIGFTRWATPEHAIGNRFVMLDPSTVQRCNLPDSLLQTAINYKVLTAGQQVGAGTVVTYTCTGESLKYPSNADVTTTLSGTDIVMRVSPSFDTYEYLRSVAPESRTYELEIWDSTFTTLKRTIMGLTPGIFAPTSPYDFQYTYSTADQTTDFGSAQSTVYLKVYGVHPTLGRNHSPKMTVVVTGAGGSGGGGSGGGTGGGGSGTRDPLQQPFASTSIWNMPIGSGATYVAAGIDNYPGANQYAYMPGADGEHIILTPTAPATDIRYSSVGWSGGDRCVSGGSVLVTVPIPSSLVIANTNKNEGAAILKADGHTIAQVQPIARCTAGSYATAMVQAADVDLYGDGITGCHGGSGLSSIGGCIRVGELRPGAATGPKHALKVNVYAKQALFQCTTRADGFRWPATTSDSYAVGWYGTDPANSNTNMKQGSLLAIPASVDITTLGLTTEPAKQLAWTLQNYGAYIVDDTYAPGFDFSIEEGPGGSKSAEFQADYGYAFAQRIGLPGSRSAWTQDIMILVANLYVVSNNSSSSIGGGGTPLQPLAPTIP